MTQHTPSSLEIGDEALEAPHQHAAVSLQCVVSGYLCNPGSLSDEALDAPKQHATSCNVCVTCNGFCGYCSVSDSIID